MPSGDTGQGVCFCRLRVSPVLGIDWEADVNSPVILKGNSGCFGALALVRQGLARHARMPISLSMKETARIVLTRAAGSGSCQRPNAGPKSIHLPFNFHVLRCAVSVIAGAGGLPRRGECGHWVARPGRQDQLNMCRKQYTFRKAGARLAQADGCRLCGASDAKLAASSSPRTPFLCPPQPSAAVAATAW